MNSSDLSQNDLRLINAHMNGDASFQQHGAELGYSPDSLSRWLLTPSIAAAINQLKNIELDRCQIIAARARTTCMHMLTNVLERAAAALTEPRPSDVSPTPYIQHFMRVATLLSRLSTFKPTQLKDLTKIKETDEAQQDPAPSNGASSTKQSKPSSPKRTSEPVSTPSTDPSSECEVLITPNTPQDFTPAPARRYPF